MELKFALLLVAAFASVGCASLTESPDCTPARQTFSGHNLNIEYFRVKPVTSDEFIQGKTRRYGGADLTFVNWGNHYLNYERLVSAAHWACGSLDGSSQPINSITSASGFIDEYVEQEKRMADASRFLTSQSNPSISEPLSLLTAHESHKFDVTDPRSSKIMDEKIKQASSIDTTKKWTREDIFTYPSQSGVLKEDARNARKDLLHQWVRSEYEDLVYIAFFNPQFQKLLNDKIPMRLPQERADKLCQTLVNQLSTKFGFNLNAEQGGDEGPDWSVRVGAMGSGLRSQQCETAVGSFSHGKSADMYREAIRELLQDKYIRFKLAEHLLATALIVDATRISDHQMKLTVQIDWPKFFQVYRFTKISDLLEK